MSFLKRFSFKKIQCPLNVTFYKRLRTTLVGGFTLKKKLFILVGCIITCLILTSYFLYKNDAEKVEISNDTNPDDNDKTEEVKEISAKNLIQNVFHLSKSGKVKEVPFIVGETTINEVTRLWGNPNKQTNTDVGKYVEFLSKDIILGIKDSIVNDVRSYQNELESVHLNDIIEFREPDEIKYYKDATTHQVILTYHKNSPYQLKWILPYPTEETPNPKVHHISLVKQTKTDFTDLDQQLSELTLDEKIGQMLFAGISSTELTETDKKLIEQYKVGGIILFKENLQSSNQILRLLKTLKETNEKNTFPLFLGLDEEGGRISRLPKEIQKLPSSLEIGKTNHVLFAYDIGRILGKQLSAFGFNLDFAPVLDINSNPNNPIIGDRSFGNTAGVVSAFGLETMRGLHSENIISVIKHFPGHGDTDVDSHLELPTISKTKEQLKELELIPFEQAIHQNADAVMIAHILLPKIDAIYPASMSKNIITDLLRDEMEFKGVVITDDLTMKAITNNYSIEEAVVQSIKAGSDILLIAHEFHNVEIGIQSIKKAINTGEITEEQINASVMRIIQLKEKYKLNHTNPQNINIEELNQTITDILNKYQS